MAKLPVNVMTLAELAELAGQGGGVVASYTTSEAEGAYRNGSRVRKTVLEAGDVHLVGAMATVVGSMGPLDGEFFYFVLWDDRPGLPVGVRGGKLELAS